MDYLDDFHSSSFIGREQEIALFEKSIEFICGDIDKKSPQILSFYGEKGIGKTTLAKVFESIGNGFGIPTVLFSLSKESDSGNSDAQKYLADLWATIVQKINILPPFKLHEIEKLKNYLQSKPLIIILDSCENYPFLINHLISVFRSILENFSPLLETHYHLLVVCFSAYPLQILLENIQTKNLFLEQELKPLSFEEAKKMLNGFVAQFPDKYLQEIYNYTQGYPSKLKFLLNLVQERKISIEIILKELITGEGKLLTNLQEAIEEKQLLQGQSSELEHNVIATMTHNLNQKFGSLLLEFNTIKVLIDKQKTDKNAENKLPEKLDDFYEKLYDATETFRTTYKVLDKQYLDFKSVDIVSFFHQKIAPVANNKNFSIQIYSNQKDLWVEIDANALQDAIQNLINNAEKHGFIENKNDYVISFDISKVKDIGEDGQELEFVKIYYKNNGAAISEKFSFEEYKRLAGRTGQNKGSGIGGYWINKVIQLHHGKFRMIRVEKNDSFAVQFEILLPLKQPKIT